MGTTMTISAGCRWMAADIPSPNGITEFVDGAAGHGLQAIPRFR